MADGTERQVSPAMSDRAAVVLACLVSLGAWAAWPVPLAFGVGALVAGLVTGRPVLVLFAGLLLAAGLGHRAAVAPSPQTGAVSGSITLLSDPEPVGMGMRVVVRLGQRHVEAWAFGRSAGKLGSMLAGEQAAIEGRWQHVPDAARARLAAVHVAGRITVDLVTDTAPGSPASLAANRLRRLLDRGASVMPPLERSLFTGFVIGDDRAEPAALVSRFRDSGLSHLTAVSGENLAFTLVAAGPLLRRLGVRGRWLSTVAIVLWFALLTRFEPSVLRAAAMSGLAATSAFLARPASALRLLALAVSLCTLIDPLLVHSAGWWLSVGATVGITVLGPPLAERLPGPRPLAEALSVTASAQIGVAPVSLALFGPLPVMALPANLLAVPAAGPVMVWGLPAGLLAGLVPRWAAWLLHLPSLVCIRWIALVATLGARVPAGHLDLIRLLTLAGSVAVALTVRRWPVRALAWVAAAAVVLWAVQADASTSRPTTLRPPMAVLDRVDARARLPS